MNDRACFVIFWGAQNIAGERSPQIPYSTIAVNTYCSISLFMNHGDLQAVFKGMEHTVLGVNCVFRLLCIASI